MRKTYMMLLVLLFTALGVTSVNAAKIQKIALEKEMFKAWTSNEPGAEVDAEPAPEPKNQGEFGCAFALYETIGTGATVYGHANVYFKWYADLTGTKKMYITGTPGIKPRLMFNRAAIEATAADPDGGTYIEIAEAIPESGVLEVDLENHNDLKTYDYLHLNAIKTPWSGTATGTITKIEIEGTVKPLTGWVEVINNGDVEDGSDLESFPVSLDGPNNGDTANDRPTIVVDDDVENYNHVLKVTSDQLTPDADNKWTEWSAQFYLKFNEALTEGTKWKLEMDVKSSTAASVTTSAQGEPRKWHTGFVDEFQTSTEWTHKSWEGTVTADQAKDGGFISVAFDLNKAADAIDFYFDNISFCKYVEGTNVVSDFKGGFSGAVVALDLTDKTNIKTLAGEKRVVLPNNSVVVTFDGVEQVIESVEGRTDGKLYVFTEEEAEQTQTVAVTFTNPQDENVQLKFTDGALKDQAVPDFTLECEYNKDLGALYSYRAEAPALVSTTPEAGSFNLSLTMSEFEVTFDALVEVAKLKAKLGNEDLTVTAVDEKDGYAMAFKLTREATELTSGKKELKVYDAYPEFDYAEQVGEGSIFLSFGPSDPSQQTQTLWTDGFSGNQTLPDGWETDSDGTLHVGPYSGGGTSTRTGDYFANPVLYMCSRGYDSQNPTAGNDGHAAFGAQGEEHAQLELDANTYHLVFDVTQWDRDGDRWLNTVIRDLEDNEIASHKEKVTKKLGKDAQHVDIEFTLEAKQKISLWFYPGNEAGTPMGWGDGLALGNVKILYKSDALGVEETELLTTALTKAKTQRDASLDEKYAGSAFTALSNAIVEHEAGMADYHSPSQFTTAAAELDAKREAMATHKANIDNYETAIKKTIDTVRQIAAETDGSTGEPNPKHFFVASEAYAEVVAAAKKYHGTSQWVNIGSEEEPSYQLEYSFDVLTDNAVLAPAIAELNAVNDGPGNMFSIGKSTHNPLIKGYAALHERLRRGVELLKSLGVAEDADEIVRANAVFGDDDEVAASIVHRAEVEILADLAKGEESTLFKGVESDPDPKTGEVTTTYPSYDLSVFAKNPNCYGAAKSTAVIGWDVVKGNVVAWSGWNGQPEHSETIAYPQDCKFHGGWHPSPYAAVEQTITNLPAGVYTIKFGCNDNGRTPMADGTYVYVKTSDTPEPESDDTFDPKVNYAGYLTDKGDIENIQVTDGKLTVGMRFSNTSQAFLDDVEIWMTNIIEGHNYAADEATGIDAKKASKVGSIQLFDVNGRRIPAAKKGLVIVKKTMADGTIKVEKIVKK